MSRADRHSWMLLLATAVVSIAVAWPAERLPAPTADRGLEQKGVEQPREVGALGFSPPPPVGSSEPGARRIVSMAPNLTELLFALGLGPQLVGVSDYSDWPAEAQSLPRLGGQHDPQLESLLALRPDLVLLLGEHGGFAEQLRSLGVEVQSLRSDRLVELLDSISLLGELGGVSEAASALRRRLEEGLAELGAGLGGCRPRVALLVGREPGAFRQLYAAGQQSYVSDMLVAAGFVNALPLSQPWPVISVETLLTVDLDGIVELRAEAMSAAQIAVVEGEWREQMGFVPAVRRGQVRVLAHPSYSIPGPRLLDFGLALAELRAQWCSGE